MATAGSIVVDLLLKTGSFETDSERAARAARKAGSEMEQGAKQAGNAWTSAGRLMGVAFAGISAAAGFSAFIQNTINAQNEQAQLAAVFTSTGRAASMSVDGLNSMAGAMEKASTFSAGEINEAQTALLAFTGIANSEIPRATQAALDMAARTGMSVKAAAETIGRSLDVPSQGLSALSRQGFRFTQEQKDLVEHLERTGKVAEAQALVMGALEESYGGAAAAARDTLGGSLIALQNTVSALLTDENGSLEVLRYLIEGVNDALGSEVARDGLNALTAGAAALAVVMGTRLTAAALQSAGGFAAAQIEAAKYQFTLAKMAGVSTSAAAGLAGVSVAARAANASLALVGGPLGAVTLVLAGAAYAWSSFSSGAEESRRKLSELLEPLDSVVSKFKELSRDQQAGKLVEQTEAYEQAAKDAEAAFVKLAGSVGLAWQGSPDEDMFELVDALRSAKENGQSLSPILTELGRKFGVPQETINSWLKLGGEFDAARGEADSAQRAIQALRQALEELANAPGVAPVVDDLAKYRENYDKFMKDFATPQERLKAAIEEQRKLMGELYSPEVEKRLRDRILPKSGGSSQSSELQSLIKNLESQEATLGMTAEQAERYRIETSKGTEADRKRALALFEQVQAWGEADKALKRAAESARYIDAINREVALFQEQQNLNIAGIGMGDRQREQLEQDLAIRREYAERRRQLEEGQQVESTKLSDAQYQLRIQALSDAEDKQIKILEGSAIRKQEAEANWLNGLSRGLQNYADEVANVSESVAQAVGRTFKGMEDALVSFTRTGKLDFKSLADSIISDMMRIAIQQNVTKPLAGLFSSAIGGLFGGLSAAPGLNLGASLGSMSDFTPINFSDGGFTGPGGRYEPAGIVHKGEGVLNQDEIRALGGATGFASLRRALRGPGHAIGGMAGRPSLPPPVSQAQQQPSLVINSTVNAAPGTNAAELDALLEERNAELRYQIYEDLRRGRVEV